MFNLIISIVWCQIVQCQIVWVPNYPGAKLFGSCYDIGVKLSILSCRCQIVLFLLLVPNCPCYDIGVKLSILSCRCQIVLFLLLVANFPLLNCAILNRLVPNCLTILYSFMGLWSIRVLNKWIPFRLFWLRVHLRCLKKGTKKVEVFKNKSPNLSSG